MPWRGGGGGNCPPFQCITWGTPPPPAVAIPPRPCSPAPESHPPQPPAPSPIEVTRHSRPKRCPTALPDGRVARAHHAHHHVTEWHTADFQRASVPWPDHWRRGWRRSERWVRGCDCFKCSGGCMSPKGPPGMHWKGGRHPHTPLQGTLPMPSRCPPNAKRRLQGHL